MSKRLNGEGSIRERKPGQWEARLAYTDDNGTTKRVSLYGKTHAEAKRKLKDAIGRFERDEPVRDAETTVAEWCEMWISTTLAASSLKPTTKQTKRNVLRLYVEPTRLGRMQLARLKASHVEAWLVEMRALTKSTRVVVQGVERVEQRPKLAEATIRKAFHALSGVLDGAVRDRMLAKSPMGVLSAPVAEEHEARFLSPEETTAILAAAREMDEDRDRVGGIQSHNYPMLAFIAATGVRKGEALALKWSDIDFDTGLVTIRSTLSRVDGHLVVTSPKTVRSRRALKLSSGVVRLLRDHRTEQLEQRLAAGGLWVDTGHVFTTVTGRPVDPSTALRVLKSAAKRAGVTGAGVHTLRHSAATAMLDAGVPLSTVSRLLGHARTGITGDVYAHLSGDAHASAMEVAASVIGL